MLLGSEYMGGNAKNVSLSIKLYLNDTTELFVGLLGTYWRSWSHSRNNYRHLLVSPTLETTERVASMKRHAVSKDQKFCKTGFFKACKKQIYFT